MIMKTGNNPYFDILYVIVDTTSDLPVYVADTYEEARAWLQVSKRWMAKILSEGIAFNGYTVEIVDDT